MFNSSLRHLSELPKPLLAKWPKMSKMAADIQKLPAPTEQSRVETGIVQFGDDWPGVFIRGDNCMGYLMGLRELLSQLSTENHAAIRINIGIVKGLVRLLESSKIT